MSEHSISLVPTTSNYPNHENKAREILKWLISRDIVKSTLSDCILSTKEGYSVSEGARKVTDDPDSLPFDLITNGLDIITERTVFHNGGHGLDEVICPSCKQNISSEEWDFLNDWSNSETDNIRCPLCSASAEIHEFKFTPEWGFSNLGLTFWNWPELKEDFLNEIRKRFSCDINIVYTRI